MCDIKKNLFGCAGSQFWHVESLVAARELLLTTWGILFAGQELKLGSLHWELEILATGPSGNSHGVTFLKSLSVDGYLGYFHILVTVKNASVNMQMTPPLWQKVKKN